MAPEFDETVKRITATAIAMNNAIAFRRAEAQLDGIRMVLLSQKQPVVGIDKAITQMDTLAKSYWERRKLAEKLRKKQ